MAGQGGLNPPPLNAPPAGQPTPGVQPGTTSPIVFALFVLIFGPDNGLFEYSGTPALGNLEASITEASADPHGNTTYPGIASYDPDGSGGALSVAQLDSGQLNLGAGFQFDGLGGASPASVTVAAAQGSGSNAILDSGVDSSSDNPAFISAFSQDAAGAGATTGYLQGSGPLQLLGSDPVPANTGGCFYQNTNDTPSAQTDAGLNGSLPIVKTDVGTYTNANQATAQPLTVDCTIPANDANVGTIYELEVPWDALCVANNAIRFDLSIDNSATNTVEASFIPGAISPNGFVRVYIQVTATGSSGKINAFINGALSQNSSNATYTNSAGFAGTDRAKGVAFDTTVSHTMRINSFWPASNASQTVSGYGSKFTRSGP